MTFTAQLLTILGVSLVATIIFRRLRLPPIVAYIVVGSLVGPYLTGWVQDPGEFSLLAEFGVAFLLFSIGLEFSMSTMLRMKYAVFVLGSLQVFTCFVVFALVTYLWGTALTAAIVIGGALALSSTAIVSRELSDQQQFNTHYAQLSIGVLLFQDLVAVVFLILVPIFGNEGSEDFSSMLLTTLGEGLAFFIVLMAAGKWLLPLIYQEVARARSDEIFALSTLVIALITAWLAHAFSLSMALGGFVIGMMLSESQFKHQIVTDIRPFKDILLGLFFVTVGMNIELTLIPEYWPRLLLFTAGLFAINIFVVALVVRIMGESEMISLRVGIALAQAGEFGLALMTLAEMNGVVPVDQASFIILIAILSMLVSPLMIRHSKFIAEKIIALVPGTRRDDQLERHPVVLHQGGHILIGGYGRVGQTIAHLLRQNKIPYIGIDKDIDIVSECRDRGDNVIYGDCSRLEILKSCHIQDAKLAVLTFRSLELAKATIREIRNQNIEVPIIVRCYEHGNLEELISLGANHVVSEMLEASLIISAQVLSILDVDPHTMEDQLQAIRSARGSLRSETN